MWIHISGGIEECNNSNRLVQNESLALEMKFFGKSTNPSPPPCETGQKRSLKSPFANSLLKCDPFIQDDILRMRERLSKSDIPQYQNIQLFCHLITM